MYQCTPEIRISQIEATAEMWVQAFQQEKNLYKRALIEIAIIAETYAACERGECKDCDLLYKIFDIARKAAE